MGAEGSWVTDASRLKAPSGRRNIQDYNRRTHGGEYWLTDEIHHYFVGSKGVSCQILAQDLHVEAFPEMNFGQVVEESWRRVGRGQRRVMKAVQKKIEEQRTKGLST